MKTFNIINILDIVKPKRYVNKMFIHCSASDANSDDYLGAKLAYTIDDWHRKRGFTQIGYHWIIDKEGNLINGRGVEFTPAAQAGYNTGTLAVCVHGLVKEKFTPKALDTLEKLCNHINGLYKGQITFHGHREVAAKECPVFDYKTVLNLDSNGKMGA